MGTEDVEKVYIILGAILRQVRSQKSIAQDDVAAILNVERSYISRIESGKKPVSLATFLKICKAIDTDSVQVLSTLMEKLEHES